MSSPSIKPVGRVIITQKEPATPYEFWAWLTTEHSSDIEIGTFLTVEGENNERLITVVEELRHTSTAEDHMQEFFSHGCGDPLVKPRTNPTIVRLAKLRVVSRYPTRLTPPESRWTVRRLTSADVEYLSSNIPSRHRVLLGFLKTSAEEGDPQSWQPVYGHVEFIIGTEGAHINISGKTGLATKTSYALFLCLSILAWAAIHNERIGIVLFNVKREDFLRLHELPSTWEEAEQQIRKWSQKLGDPRLGERTIALWKRARDEGVDPIKIKPQVRYFTYQNDPYASLMPSPVYYSYGLADLERGEVIAALFEAEETAEQQVNLVDSYLRTYSHASFEDFERDLYNALRGGSGSWVTVAGTSWHRSTVGALLRRLNGFKSRATHVISWKAPKANPIKFNSLVEGFNVIQLYGLLDDGKRLVVNAVLREISRGLENPQRHLDAVVVVVDELNKYAPKGRSPIKEQIVEIVARGRDLRMSLIGAEQFASRVDRQVVGNCATIVVGKSDYAEIREDVYRILGDFRHAVLNLEKGQLLVQHHIYQAPFVIWFPAPLHQIQVRVKH